MRSASSNTTLLGRLDLEINRTVFNFKYCAHICVVMKFCHGVCSKFSKRNARGYIARSLTVEAAKEGYRKCKTCKIILKGMPCPCCGTKTTGVVRKRHAER